MITFIVGLAHLTSSVLKGLREDREFRALSLVMVIVIAGGTAFYWRWENWSVIDALYFCVVTMATIGYGDLTPTRPLSKLFTIVYVFLGVGTFAAVIGKLVTYIIKPVKPKSEA